MVADGAGPRKGSRPRVLLRNVLAEPRAALEKTIEATAARWERVRRRGALPRLTPDPDWERSLHGLIGAEWPCPDAARFWDTWANIQAAMAGRRLPIECYNADPALARALWCLVRHLHPREIVETGVAHGVSSRTMLEALERNGSGNLSSIDLPPFTVPELRAEVAAAVPERLRDRWQFLKGSSRRHLPPLLRRLVEIDLFIHDSHHSTRNVQWELAKSWRALRLGGIVVVDDVHSNWGFEQFRQTVDDLQPLFCTTDDARGMFAVARKGTDRD